MARSSSQARLVGFQTAIHVSTTGMCAGTVIAMGGRPFVHSGLRAKFVSFSFCHGVVTLLTANVIQLCSLQTCKEHLKERGRIESHSWALRWIPHTQFLGQGYLGGLLNVLCFPSHEIGLAVL